MFALLFVTYVVVEIAALAWLGSTVGALSTVLLFLAVSVLGYAVLGAQGRRALRNLTDLRRGTAPLPSATPDRLVTDGMLLGAGTALVLIPGLVTTAVGLVLLLPTRAAFRPLVHAWAARRPRTAPLRAQRLVVVDGQVVDHTVLDTDPRLTPPGAPTHRRPPLDGQIIDSQIIDPAARPDEH